MKNRILAVLRHPAFAPFVISVVAMAAGAKWADRARIALDLAIVLLGGAR